MLYFINPDENNHLSILIKTSIEKPTGFFFDILSSEILIVF